MTQTTLKIQNQEITLRSPTPVDTDAILAFAQNLPEHDLLYMRRDITKRSVVDAWMTSVAEGRTFSFLAEENGEIVGMSGLFIDGLSWSPHVGEIRVLVGRNHRRIGLGRHLIQQSVMNAIEHDVEKIIAQMTIDQVGARMLFEESGFAAEALLKDHVKDQSGETHDILILSCEVARVTNQMIAAR